MDRILFVISLALVCVIANDIANLYMSERKDKKPIKWFELKRMFIALLIGIPLIFIGSAPYFPMLRHWISRQLLLPFLGVVLILLVVECLIIPLILDIYTELKGDKVNV